MVFISFNNVLFMHQPFITSVPHPHLLGLMRGSRAKVEEGNNHSVRKVLFWISIQSNIAVI